MFFGAQYYRPPFPYACDWERDIRHMKELGFNVVKLWAVWNAIEREQGVFDFADLDQLVALCAKEGLQVIINTIPEGAPYWTQSMPDEYRYHTSEGLALHYSGPANIPSAGWPGLCHDGEAAGQLIENFIYQTAAHFAGNPTVFAIDIWNEPHLEPMFDYSGELLCYCSHSIAQFRAWLKERYGSIEELNRNWFRFYTDWQQVEPPIRFGTSADMIDWRRFWLFNLARWMQRRADAARKGAPDKIIQSHSAFSGYMGAQNRGGLGNELGDEFLLCQPVDQYGLSSFPLWLMGKEHVRGHLINAEIIAEAAGDKPFYQVELQGGAGKAGLLGGLVPSETDVRQWNWNVIAAGGKGVVYWQYAPEPAGMESPGFGLIDSLGGDTPRLMSASKCARQFNQDYLTKAKRVPSVNGIFLSRDSDLLTYAAKEEEKYNASFVGVYNALTDRGIPVRFVHQDTFSRSMQENLTTLYLPMALSLSKEEQRALLAFVQNGGKLIVEGCTGMYGVNGEMDPAFSFLQELFGMNHVTLEATQEEFSHASGECFAFNSAWYRQLFRTRAEDAVVAACYADGTPAMLTRRVGKGTAVWLGGFVGAAYERTMDEETGRLIASLFDLIGFAELEVLDANGMLVRLLSSEGNLYAIAVNHSDSARELTIRLRGGATAEQTIPPQDGSIIPLS